MCRPRSLFAAAAALHNARALRLMVWTDDDDYRVGSRLAFDVFPGYGTTVELFAEVAWVDEQPANAPARYRLGLEVSAPTESALDEVERLLAE